LSSTCQCMTNSLCVSNLWKIWLTLRLCSHDNISITRNLFILLTIMVPVFWCFKQVILLREFFVFLFHLLFIFEIGANIRILFILFSLYHYLIIPFSLITFNSFGYLFLDFSFNGVSFRLLWYIWDSNLLFLIFIFLFCIKIFIILSLAYLIL